MKILDSKVKEKILKTTIKKKVTCKGEKYQTGIGHVSGVTESKSQGEGLCREKNKKSVILQLPIIQLTNKKKVIFTLQKNPVTFYPLPYLRKIFEIGLRPCKHSRMELKEEDALTVTVKGPHDKSGWKMIDGECVI